jgi:hypothetical protein
MSGGPALHGWGILEGNVNFLKTQMLDRKFPHSKKFRKRGLTPFNGCATRGALLAEKPWKLFIFNMFRIFSCSSSSCITWGQFPEKPKKARVPGYPHLWRSLWKTPGPLWKRTGGIASITDHVFSIT